MQEMFDIISKLLHPFIFIIPLIILFKIIKYLQISTQDAKTNTKFPKCYPIIGHLIAFVEHELNGSSFEWLTSLVINSPSATFPIELPFGPRTILTGNPKTVEHILKTRFSSYPKGVHQKTIFTDLLGHGIFNVDGEKWKFQRRVASYEFSTKSLRRFVETVVDTELSDRLIPILSDAARNCKVVDLQDVLQRFAFDNICRIGFGYDPEYLSPSFPESKFTAAFENSVMITSKRRTLFPILWRMCKFLNIGEERKLKDEVLEVKEFATAIVKQRKQEIEKNPQGFLISAQEDLLSRFLNSSQYDEKFVTDIVISFILAGRDTTSAALTWFFWLLYENKQVEEEIVREIFKNTVKQNDDSSEHSSVYEEVKDRVYLHAALCESMRLYPPVPVDTKEAAVDDVLPDGTRVKKGNRVTYHPYAMGRMESIWGPDWAEYRPERWLDMGEKEEHEERKWKFVPRDPYSYPVFQAGPRICLGKEMAFLQMKRVVTGILERFRVIPLMEKGVEPIFLPQLTAKMKGGLPVRIEERTILE